MNLHSLLIERQAQGRPVRVGLIGAGKFGSMFLAQARRMPGLHLLGVCDLDLERARANCLATGWAEERIAAPSLSRALESGETHLCEDAEALIAADGLEVVIEGTGDAGAAIRHALMAFREGRHVVMVSVEGDALAGPLLAKRAAQAGVIYSLAYGDQPALVCELVDWARTCGFEVVCAGKGTRYLPAFHASTPETVWRNFGWDEDMARRGGMRPKMFNSFIDGSKSSIEMAAVANATNLTPADGGLGFPPARAEDLANICRPREHGGRLSHKGTVEVVSSLERDGSELPGHLQWGVYVTFEADGEYVSRCFQEYCLMPDDEGRYAALYRPVHLIGLEMGVSIASIACRGEPTGRAGAFRADVVATAKRDLRPGEVLDGEGGYCVWGRLMPSAASLAQGALPLGLAQGVRLKRAVGQGQSLAWSDVEIDATEPAAAFRLEMEAAFGGPETAARASA